MANNSEISGGGEDSSSSPLDLHQPGWKYDAFLSFRGEDTRKNFVDHLYSALERSGIHTFKDDERLETGESISPALLQAIEESMIAIIVFSKNYANSRWCLDELVKIMECRRGSSNSSMGSQIVFPIFYDVQPSDVREPDEGYFGEMISQHDPAKVEMWRRALGEAANISGLELKKTADGYEAKFIDNVVDKICRKLMDIIPSDEDEGLVGMKSRIEEVTSLLDLESEAVRIVGIWGLSGIGKTTLANAVFCRIKNHFQAVCFLKEVGEESKRHGLKDLLQQLLSQLVGEKDLKIKNDCEGDIIKRRLRSRRVLLVLDDVDHLDQLKVLGKRRFFGPGSRIVITTRDEHLLVVHGADEIYKARFLNDAEAIRLFCWNAFKGIRPVKDFEDLSDEVIHYSGGLPLALEVLGSALCGENLGFWKATLEKLRKAGPDTNILNKLKLGFDGLDKEVQETFLDIACFFLGQEKEHVTRILKSFDFYPDRSIPILVRRSLIYVSKRNILCMHQLVQEMGWHINREKPRRLWLTNDIVRVLRSPTDIENIEGISLHPRKRKSVDIATDAFRKMPKLRLLDVGNVRIDGVPEYLPRELKWLIWDEFPSESLPPMFEPHNLVGLQLCNSRIERPWKHKKMMDKLKYIDLSYSEKLLETPDFTGTPNLEKLILFECTSLVVVHQSLGALKHLVCLDLRDCTNLKSLPNSINSECLQTFEMARCQSLRKFPEIPVIMKDVSQLNLKGIAISELPSSIKHLPNLVLLNLKGCKSLASLPSAVCMLKCLEGLYLSNCSKLDKLPEDLGCLECLEDLDLDETAIKEVPSSIQHLNILVQLNLRDSKNLLSLPSAVCKLKRLERLYLSGCSELEKLPEDLGCLERLEELDLNGTAIKEVPLSIQHLSNLVKLSLRDNENLSSLPSAVCKWKRLERLYLSGCSKLEKLPEDLGCLECLVELDLNETAIKEVPSSIQDLSNLAELSLRDNKNLSSLPSAVCKLKRLERLYLSGCSELEKLPEDLGCLECLEELDLNGTAIEEVPSSIQHLSSLVELSLRDNENLSSLPSAVCKWKRLERLYLSGCSELEKLPEDLGCLECLVELDLDGTAIKEVPSSIEDLSSLVELSLRDNKNLSSLPSAVCKWKRLERLYLSGCSELEKLPEDLGYLECLVELDLDGTAIQEIPSSIQHLSSLVELSLRDNKNLLSLPSAVCKLKCLEYLYLSGCSELEKLPEDLGCLECLVELGLDGTAIKEVPSSIEDLSSLVELSLRDNKNLSSLPSAVCKLKCLERLYLSGCSELKNLPEDLGCLECLEKLDLDETAITQLPLSIGRLNKLKIFQSSSISSAFPFCFARKRKRQEKTS